LELENNCIRQLETVFIWNGLTVCGEHKCIFGTLLHTALVGSSAATHTVSSYMHHIQEYHGVVML